MFEKWQEFGGFWPEHMKFAKFPLLLAPLCKVYNVWPKKCRGVIFKDTEEGYKIWRITNCGTNLEDDMRNIANFYHSIWKYQNWDFDGIFLSKVENVWA